MSIKNKLHKTITSYIKKALTAYADWRVGATKEEKHSYNNTDKILLTFDDYADANTVLTILALLAKENIKAAFFVVGDWAKKNPDLIKKIKQQGHWLGNHTKSHKNLLKLSRNEIEKEILGGLKSNLLRPPYGAYNATLRNIAKKHGYQICYWDIDSQDWKGISASQIVENVMNSMHTGACILLHLNGKNTVKALPFLIKKIKKNGYTFCNTKNEIIKKNTNVVKKNLYIVNHEYFIKADLESVLLYFEFFSQGFSPIMKYTDSQVMRKVADKTLKYIIIFVYFSKFYKYICKTVELNEDALIMLKRNSNWSSSIKLLKKNGVLKILKQTSNSKIFEREKLYYETYKNTSSNIVFPKYKFLTNNIIEMEFLKLKSFQRLVTDGSIDYNKSLYHFRNIETALYNIYKKQKTLIHGDLFLTNIFIKDNKYYFIDYTDSHINTISYDLYLLLYSILCSYNKGSVKKRNAYWFKKIASYLNTSTAEVKKFEKNYQLFLKKKFVTATVA